MIGPGEQDVFLQSLPPDGGEVRDVRLPARKVAPFLRKKAFRAERNVNFRCHFQPASRPLDQEGCAFAEHRIDVRGRAIAGARHRPAQGVAEAKLRAERCSGVAVPSTGPQSVVANGPVEGAGPAADREGQPAAGEARQARAEPRETSRPGNLPPPADVGAEVGVETLEQSRPVEDLRHRVAVAGADLRDDEAPFSHCAHVKVLGPGRDHARRALWSWRSGPSARAIGAGAAPRAVRPAAARFPSSHQCAQAPGDALAKTLPWQLERVFLGPGTPATSRPRRMPEKRDHVLR